MYFGVFSEAKKKKCSCRMNFALFIVAALLLTEPWSAGSSRVLRGDGGGTDDVQTVLVVSNEGRPEHFASVQAAVDAVPMWNYLRWVIYIKPGVYHGSVVIPEGKDFITFLGEDAATTTLTSSRNASDTHPDGSPLTILDCPTVIVEASNFLAAGITFENSSPKPADLDYNSQAPAIRVSGDQCAFYECVFLGWQDTLYADQGKQYYHGCRVEGNVDFILGYASAVFENCTIHSRGEGFITAQSRWCEDDCLASSNSTFLTSNSAFVLLRSNLTGYDMATYHSTGTGLTYLGRPWRQYAKVVVLDSTLGAHIAPEGWIDWLTDSGPLFAHEFVYFGEFNNTGPGANASERVPWSHQLTEVEAEGYRDVTGFLGTQSWLEEKPLLQELREANLVREESVSGFREKFPPRRWKRLGDGNSEP